MNRRDIIEILTTDEKGRHQLRRVRVTELRDLGDEYRLTGENLQGENPKQYTVPKRPYKGELRHFRAEIGWTPTGPVVVGEE